MGPVNSAAFLGPRFALCPPGRRREGSEPLRALPRPVFRSLFGVAATSADSSKSGASSPELFVSQ